MRQKGDARRQSSGVESGLQKIAKMSVARGSQRKSHNLHKWAIEFERSKVAGQVRQADLVAPQGYTDRTLGGELGSRDVNADIIAKKSWDIALGPIKQIPMNLFIMWMAGNSISIFPIMMVGMMFIRPIQALLSVQQTFKMIDGDYALLQRFVYFIGNLAGLGLAIYKCQVMGLLPTHPSDWLAFVEPQKRMEWSGGGLSL